MIKGMKFETFQLDNQLEVLTISDPRFVKSSAALAVMAGSMQNPDEHLGLAHFLEHMLFLGTKEFPQVGEYEDYLNKNGGGHNAYTSIDHTNYFFDVTHSAFKGALERFSRFFVSPTFDQQFVEREKNAVHSEHEKNLKDDHRREYRFLQLMTDPHHPFSKFATGDGVTLKNADRDIVMDFYQKHYSSNLMRLVLMGSVPSAELKSLAQEYFSDILNKNIATPEYSDQLFKNKENAVIHFVESVRDQDVLKLSFSIPDEIPFWQSKPTSFLAQLLGDEGEGSLLSYLKEKGMASGLETSTWWRIFHIRIHLTEKGKKDYEEVMKLTFAFIRLIKENGLKEYVFEERKTMAQVDFDHIEPKSSMSRASHFSASMLYYPADQFMSCHYLYHKYKPEVFQQFLDRLNTDNFQACYFSKDHKGSQVEEFYGIRYETKPISQNLIAELNKVQVPQGIFYPEANPFIPRDLKLIKSPTLEKPILEKYNETTWLYSQLDTELEIPRGSISVCFISDYINADPRKYLLAKLYAKLKREELNEWGYYAHVAGLNYNISHGFNTVTLDVSGYSQHLDELISELIFDEKHDRALNRIKISEELFERIKSDFKKDILNREHDAAYQHLLYEVSHLFSSASVHRETYSDMIDSVQLHEINDFALQFFNNVAIRTYSYGNIQKDDVKKVVDLFYQKTKAKPLDDQAVQKFENKFLDLSNQSYFLSCHGHNNNNAQLSIYRMSPWTIKDQAIIDVIGKVLEQPYFTELRTHQQLGYIVAAFPSVNYGFCGLATLIQSQSHEVSDILNRSHEFMEKFFSQFKDTITSDDVELIKESVIQEISQLPNSLSERLSRFTQMAATYHGDFTFFDRWIEETKALSKDKLISYIDQYQKSPWKKSVLTLTYSSKDPLKEYGYFEKITNKSEFKNRFPKVQPYRQTKV